MDNYPEITEYFNTLIENSHSIDLAEAEFKRIISDDPQLKEQYRDWCHENGHSSRDGFRDYADEYLDNTDEVWDSLNDYDEDE